MSARDGNTLLDASHITTWYIKPRKFDDLISLEVLPKSLVTLFFFNSSSSPPARSFAHVVTFLHPPVR